MRCLAVAAFLFSLTLCGAYGRDADCSAPPAGRAGDGSAVQTSLCALQKASAEGRAVWEHAGTGPFPGDWERGAKLLADSGFNMIISNMLSSGEAHFASDVLPQSGTFRKYGDQIQQCCAAAKKYGLAVHVWKVNFYMLGASSAWGEKLQREQRTQVTVDGKPYHWLCPSHPDNRKLELDSMLEIARKYPIAGLHFDYIRYPNEQMCYCDGCRERFEKQSGRKVADWPAECYTGARKEEYAAWRRQQITSLVAMISRAVRQARPDIKLSAAVFPAYPRCCQTVAQDWLEWVKAGYVDFLCPMDYTGGDGRFGAVVAKQLKLIDGRVPLYPGIGATATGLHLTPEQVVRQIQKARAVGAAGFTIFNYDAQTAKSLIPSLADAVHTHGDGALDRPSQRP